VQLINHWNDHGPANDTSSPVDLVAGQKYTITMEYYERGGGAVARLRWLVPGSSSYVAIPSNSLFLP
jgi:MSHA biogenesis protein MshQ